MCQSRSASSSGYQLIVLCHSGLEIRTFCGGVLDLDGISKDIIPAFLNLNRYSAVLDWQGVGRINASSSARITTHRGIGIGPLHARTDAGFDVIVLVALVACPADAGRLFFGWLAAGHFGGVRCGRSVWACC